MCCYEDWYNQHLCIYYIVNILYILNLYGKLYFIDELPYEENLLKGQSFLSYVYTSQFKVFIQPEPNTVDEMEAEIFEFIKNPSVSLYFTLK